jgi:hypothetical protein
MLLNSIVKRYGNYGRKVIRIVQRNTNLAAQKKKDKNDTKHNTEN